MPTLSWGIAAAGRITHDFVTALSTLEPEDESAPSPLHVVHAVADVDVQRARDFAQRHGIAKYYDGFDALACDPQVQVVYVGTLNPFHYAVVRLMLQRGKHVLCEKPICLCYAQAAELYRLAKERGLFLMEGMWSRFFPSYQRLQELLHDGEHGIGEVSLVQVQHGFRAQQVERIATRSLGGSITLDIGLYALQLGQFIFGAAPQSVKASAHLNADGVDVECELILQYAQNRKLAAFVTGLDNVESCAKIIGTKGEIKLSNYWCCTSLTRPNNKTESWPLPAAKHEFHHTNSCGLRYEAEEVRKCIEKRLIECPTYTHAQSLELIRIEDEIRRQIGVRFDDVLNLEL